MWPQLHNRQPAGLTARLRQLYVPAAVYEQPREWLQGADALERASRVRTVVFDKTGTLTRGAPAVTGHALFGGVSLHGALALAAAAEAASEHPLAKAVLAHAAAHLATADAAPGAPAARADGAVSTGLFWHVLLAPCVCPAARGWAWTFRLQQLWCQGLSKSDVCSRAPWLRRRGAGPELGAPRARCGGHSRPRAAVLGGRRGGGLGGRRRVAAATGGGRGRRAARAHRQPAAHCGGGRSGQQVRVVPCLGPARAGGRVMASCAQRHGN